MLNKQDEFRVLHEPMGMCSDHGHPNSEHTSHFATRIQVTPSISVLKEFRIDTLLNNVRRLTSITLIPRLKR
jgi:hypothetical protein